MNIHIIWDEANLPIIKSNLSNVIDVIDDTIAVSFDTWLFSSNGEFVIEFYHDGQTIIGLK
ncbi:hypothetical protein GCM10008906_23480 [Clostridium oceanicum]|uniref:Uncharacterized protein n=2 Tax=Clostridium oceanicum TaxID=1543 RepID=A0ABN1JKQ9_9CLOT